MQYFFINGRLVKSKTALAALEQAYKNSIMVGRFPACVLNITVNTALVDVNVHPAKIECALPTKSRCLTWCIMGSRPLLRPATV